MESILTSIKHMLGITENYTQFDGDIIIHINSAMSILHQLGYIKFSIVDDTGSWKDYLGTEIGDLELIKTYIYLKVKLLFDPPANATVLNAYNNMLSELEWRIYMECGNNSDEENC